MASERDDDLQPQLEAAEEQLAQTLDDVCSGPAPGQIDTGELIRVEETLAIAADAAKQAVTLRRKLRAGRKRSEGGED